MKAMKFTIDQWSHGGEINAMEMYLTLNERKSVITERFIRTLKFINTWLQYQEMCIFIS